jgi:hypothetical protein
MHAPVEEVIKDTYTILFPNNPQSFELVVLSHVPEVVLDEVVNVLAEEVHARVGEKLLAVLGVDDELQEEHEE